LQPLAGRKLFFVGIGGAGLSGYALLAQAWGADVSGWDRNDTPYLEHVRAAGIPVEIADEITPAPEGALLGVAAPSSSRSSCRTRRRSSSPGHMGRRQPRG
jgi:UDP-N-acetylmuramate-alanine ligase